MLVTVNPLAAKRLGGLVRPAGLIATRVPRALTEAVADIRIRPQGARPGLYVGGRGQSSAKIHITRAVEVEAVTSHRTAAGRRCRRVPKQAELARMGWRLPVAAARASVAGHSELIAANEADCDLAIFSNLCQHSSRRQPAASRR